MMNSLKSHNTKGNIMLELALVLPVFLLLIAGIIQFGFMLNAKIAVNSAAYEAARVATVSEDPYNAAIAAALDYAGSNLPGWNYSQRLKTNVDIPGTTPGTPLTVTVIYQVPVFFSNLKPFSEYDSNFANIKGTSVMRVEEKE